MTEERRGHGAMALAGLLPRVTGKALRERGFVETAIVTRWTEIVGDDLARDVAPDRIRFSRGKRSDGVLHVRVAGAAALELQHRIPAIVERVNTFFGYPAVARVRMVQAPMAVGEERRPTDRRRPLDAATEAALADAVRNVADDRLREALLRLGRAIRSARGDR
jgi:hypothetical protein